MDIFIVTLGQNIRIKSSILDDLLQSHNTCNWPWEKDSILLFNFIKEKEKIYQHEYLSEIDYYRVIRDSLNNRIDHSLKHGETCVFVTTNELDINVMRTICKQKENQNLTMKIIIIDRYDDKAKKYLYSLININSKGRYMDFLPNSFENSFIDNNILNYLVDWGDGTYDHVCI